VVYGMRLACAAAANPTSCCFSSGGGKEPQKFVLNAQLGNCCLCSPRVAAAFTLGPAFMIGLSALGANLGRKMFNARRFDRQ
jgi:hypothetical protein